MSRDCSIPTDTKPGPRTPGTDGHPADGRTYTKQTSRRVGLFNPSFDRSRWSVSSNTCGVLRAIYTTLRFLCVRSFFSSIPDSGNLPHITDETSMCVESSHRHLVRSIEWSATGREVSIVFHLLCAKVFNELRDLELNVAHRRQIPRLPRNRENLLKLERARHILKIPLTSLWMIPLSRRSQLADKSNSHDIKIW